MYYLLTKSTSIPLIDSAFYFTSEHLTIYLSNIYKFPTFRQISFFSNFLNSIFFIYTLIYNFTICSSIVNCSHWDIFSLFYLLFVFPDITSTNSPLGVFCSKYCNALFYRSSIYFFMYLSKFSTYCNISISKFIF